MMELYQDPEGETITTFASTAQKQESTNGNSSNDIELRNLRRRVVELEDNLRQHVSELVSHL